VKKINIITKRIFAGALLCQFMMSASAQHNRLKRENFLTDYVFKGNHIQFNFATLATLKAKLKKESGNYPVSSNQALGFLLSFKYQLNFNNEYSLITGPEATILGRNLIVSFNKNDFTPPLIMNYKINGTKSYMGDFLLSLPIMAEKRWLYNKTKYLFASTGLRLNFSTGADFESFSINLMRVDSSFYDVGGTELYANNDAKPWISFPINAGYGWLLKNNNVLQLTLCSNVSFTKYVNGTFQIDVPGNSVTKGKYSSTGSFIGLSLNYVFTNANYRIRKAYEKKR